MLSQDSAFGLVPAEQMGRPLLGGVCASGQGGHVPEQARHGGLSPLGAEAGAGALETCCLNWA